MLFSLNKKIFWKLNQQPSKWRAEERKYWLHPTEVWLGGFSFSSGELFHQLLHQEAQGKLNIPEKWPTCQVVLPSGRGWHRWALKILSHLIGGLHCPLAGMDYRECRHPSPGDIHSVHPTQGMGSTCCGLKSTGFSSAWIITIESTNRRENAEENNCKEHDSIWLIQAHSQQSCSLWNQVDDPASTLHMQKDEPGVSGHVLRDTSITPAWSSWSLAHQTFGRQDGWAQSQMCFKNYPIPRKILERK